MEQEEEKVASEDFFEAKQSEGATEKGFWRPFHGEGHGRSRGVAAPRAAWLATRGEGCQHLVGAARVRAKGAVSWGEVGAGGTTMACLVQRRWCDPQFQAEAQRSLMQTNARETEGVI